MDKRERTWYNMHILVAENGRMAIHTMCGLRTWYNDSAFAEYKPACAGLTSLRDALYQAIHGLKSKCPFGALPFLRTWYNDFIIIRSTGNEQ